MAATQVPLLSRSAPQVNHVRVDPTAHLSKPTGLAREVLGFHGTDPANVESIVRDGFRPGIHGSHGGAIYTSSSATYSHDYSTRHLFTGASSKKRHNATIIGCRVLGHSGEIWHHMNAVIEPARVLPVALLHYTYCRGK